MFRIMSIATLVMIVLCFFVGASLAFADEGSARPATIPATSGQVNDASRPVETTFEENQAQNDREGDSYDFSDYFQQPTTAGSVPPVDSEKIEEPDLNRFEKMDC